MRIVFPMIIMLVAGLSLGASGASLVWSGLLTRSQHGQGEWKKVSDRFEGIARKNQAGWNECLALVETRSNK